MASWRTLLLTQCPPKSFREQMKKSRSSHARECGKRARENAFLVREIEELKRELKAVRGCKVPRRLTRSVRMGSQQARKYYSKFDLE